MINEKWYRVTWCIEVEATSPENAAQLARETQLDPESTATFFEVWNEEEDTSFEVDLAEE